MKEDQGLIAGVLGKSPVLTRPSYGSMPGLNEALRNKVVENGLKVWDWTIESNIRGVIPKMIKRLDSQLKEIKSFHYIRLSCQKFNGKCSFSLYASNSYPFSFSTWNY